MFDHREVPGVRSELSPWLGCNVRPQACPLEDVDVDIAIRVLLQVRGQRIQSAEQALEVVVEGGVVDELGRCSVTGVDLRQNPIRAGWSCARDCGTATPCWRWSS